MAKKRGISFYRGQEFKPPLGCTDLPTLEIVELYPRSFGGECCGDSKEICPMIRVKCIWPGKPHWQSEMPITTEEVIKLYGIKFDAN